MLNAHISALGNGIKKKSEGTSDVRYYFDRSVEGRAYVYKIINHHLGIRHGYVWYSIVSITILEYVRRMICIYIYIYKNNIYLYLFFYLTHPYL